MPKTNKDGSAKQSELPSTLQRSSDKAQRTFAHTYDAALESYDGDEERAHRTAFASLKHTHEKVGDHWEAKDEPGPSDERAERGGPTGGESAGGVDANATKAHMMELAKRLDVKGRSRITKAELVEALHRANERATREARED